MVDTKVPHEVVKMPRSTEVDWNRLMRALVALEDERLFPLIAEFYRPESVNTVSEHKIIDARDYEWRQ